MLVVPVIADGLARTVIAAVEVQPAPLPYDMIAVPVAIAVTTPVGATVATEGLPLLQEPNPLTCSVMVLPAHIFTAPVMALGAATTVTTRVVRHPPAIMYEMLATPPATPNTSPLAEPIVATEVLALSHVPPVALFVQVVLAPMHTPVEPEIVPGVPTTVTTAVLKQPPAME